MGRSTTTFCFYDRSSSWFKTGISWLYLLWPTTKTVNISAYDEQFIVAKLDVIKRSLKRFLWNAENYVDFAARNPLIKPASNTPNSNSKLRSEFAPRNPEYSAITENDNSISRLETNNSNSNLQIETVNIPHSIFALNRSTDKLPNKLNNFERIADNFNSVLMMSNSDEETLMQVKQSTPSKVRFANEAGPSTAPAVQATPCTPNTDTTTVTTPSTDYLYTDAFNFALSKMFSSTLMASLTTKDAILKEIRDCILTEYEDQSKQISPYLYSFCKDLHVKNGCVCIDERIAIPNSIKDTYVEAIHATHPGSWGMTDTATHAWWPYIHRDIVTKTAKCNPFVKIDLETVRWDELILEENWDVEARSDTELEHNRDELSKDAARRWIADPEKESRTISHPEVGLPVPRTETSLAVKLAKKKPKKKSLHGLYEVLAPGSSVVKTDTYTSDIKEPGKRDVTIRNSGLAKFGTKAEHQTEHKCMPIGGPKYPPEKQ